MTGKQCLIEAFDYDLWANHRWLKFLNQGTKEEQQVFGHMLMAQELWAMRLAGNSPTSFPVVEQTETNLVRLHGIWVGLIQSRELEETVNYQRTNGDIMSSTVYKIARHVTNHGTYHRGHIRGLCQARNCNNFPETDFILYP